MNTLLFGSIESNGTSHQRLPPSMVQEDTLELHLGAKDASYASVKGSGIPALITSMSLAQVWTRQPYHLQAGQLRLEFSKEACCNRVYAAWENYKTRIASFTFLSFEEL